MIPSLARCANFVAEITAGVALEYNDRRLSYAHSFRSKEHKGRGQGQFFGTVSLSFPF